MSHPITPDLLDRIRGLSDGERTAFLCWLSGYREAEFGQWLDRWQTGRAARLETAEVPADLALVAPTRIGVCRTCAGIVEYITTGPDPGVFVKEKT